MRGYEAMNLPRCEQRTALKEVPGKDLLQLRADLEQAWHAHRAAGRDTTAETAEWVAAELRRRDDVR